MTISLPIPPSFDGYSQETIPTWDQPTTASHSRVIAAAIDLLSQGESLLTSLDAKAYGLRAEAVFNASIGGHYRHCLDHFSCLMHGTSTGLVDYDHRERDRRLEQDPSYALRATRELLLELRGIDPEVLNDAVVARCEVSYEPGNSPVTKSSLGREWVYAIAHGIHHYAMISVIARLQNVVFPENFGVAPSTVAHNKGTSGN